MSGTLATYLRAQDAAVVDNFIDDGWCVCAAVNAAELRDLAGRRGRTVERLGDLEPEEALVVRHGGHAELWVRARRSDYAGPWRSFAQQVHRIGFPSVPAGYNVDHLFSRGRVRTAGAASDPDDDRLPYPTLVCMLLVDASVNKSFGGLMEGSMIGTGNPDRPVRRFTWLQLLKALSIDANLHGGGFGGDQVGANFAHAAQELERRGICAAMHMGREQIMGALMSGAQTVLHFRAG